MDLFKRLSIFFGIMIPLLAGAYWAGSGYVEFRDRLDLLERDVSDLRELRVKYNREQTRDEFVNEQVARLIEDVEWLKYHHHDSFGGIGHTD